MSEIKEIFVHDSDIGNCTGCPSLMLYRGDYCKLQQKGCFNSDKDIEDTCPLKSIEQHDNKIKQDIVKEFAEKAKNAINDKKYKAGFSANMLWAIDANNCIDEIAEQFGKEE